MRNLKLLLAVCALGSFVACSTEEWKGIYKEFGFDNSDRVSYGYVKDAFSNKSLPDVKVSYKSGTGLHSETFTDKNGRFVFLLAKEDLIGVEERFTFTKEGYRDYYHISIQPFGEKIRMTPMPFYVSPLTLDFEYDINGSREASAYMTIKNLTDREVNWFFEDLKNVEVVPNIGALAPGEAVSVLVKVTVPVVGSTPTTSWKEFSSINLTSSEGVEHIVLRGKPIR